VREWNEEILKKADTGASERVSRGGNWHDIAGICAVSPRYRSTPATRNYIIGLRVARAATDTTVAPAEAKK